METRESSNAGRTKLDYGAFARHGLSDVVAHFDRCGYVPLPGLLPASTVADLREEIAAVLPLSKRRDFVMECMDNTPRNMTTVGGLAIAERSPTIVDLYNDARLVSGISGVVGRSLEAAGDPVERHVLNMLHEAGDTHGFHTDDYPVALVLFIESPDCPDGCGKLEFCPVENVHEAQTRSHAVGDAYVLRSDRLRHRVQPIHSGCRRTVLNFAYAVQGETVEHTPSASLLYS